MQAFGNAGPDWLRTSLKLPKSILLHDTFGRVLAHLAPEAFQRCLVSWVQAIADGTEETVLALDGNDLPLPCKGGLYMVSPGAHRWQAGASWASDGRRANIAEGVPCVHIATWLSSRPLRAPSVGAGARLKRPGMAPCGCWGLLTAWALWPRAPQPARSAPTRRREARCGHPHPGHPQGEGIERCPRAISRTWRVNQWPRQPRVARTRVEVDRPTLPEGANLSTSRPGHVGERAGGYAGPRRRGLNLRDGSPIDPLPRSAPWARV